MDVKLKLHKETEIKINMPRFIKYILQAHHSKRPLTDGQDFNDEICNIINEITGCDLYDYDNTYYVIETLMKNALIYAIEKNYPQTDIDMLNEIINLI